MMMVLDDAGTPWTAAVARQELAVFRHDFYQCVSRRADALFELCDAVLCASGPVTSLPELTLDPVYRRGHGAMYDALAAGQIDLARLRRSLAGLVLPRRSQGQLRLAVDVTPWAAPGRRMLTAALPLPPALPLRRGSADHPGLAV